MHVLIFSTSQHIYHLDSAKVKKDRQTDRQKGWGEGRTDGRMNRLTVSAVILGKNLSTPTLVHNLVCTLNGWLSGGLYTAFQ
jgi:hypothetical protein